MRIIKKKKTGMRSLKELRDTNNWMIIEYGNSINEEKEKYMVCPCCAKYEEIKK